MVAFAGGISEGKQFSRQSGRPCARQVTDNSFLRAYDFMVSHLSLGHLLQSVAALADILRGVAAGFGTFWHGFKSSVSASRISRSRC